MPAYVASYDLKETKPDPHPTFLKQAAAQGWKLWILSSNNVRYRLPNTTLIGTFDNLAVAEARLEAARLATENEMGRNVTTSKWIVAEYGPTRFNSDERQSA
ncbi:hypothetical protein [Bradyrhizobium manausense]|uniref:Uncharacterized protein n=1 Tax=Bradyrhizobium manausense TaxID=989370 RepID=A0A0R3EC29_9BRAD|nr:hypothetical protein [Bradyrhizobium manausense]KRQ16863.1 hypothetical protein AOQ71_04345 [Bradyrhizobium manausense]